jgi:hypothetical protein
MYLIGVFNFVYTWAMPTWAKFLPNLRSDPRLYENMVDIIRHLYKSDPNHCLNFSNSLYPMAKFNLSSAVTIGHTDYLNMPGSSCTISC